MSGAHTMQIKLKQLIAVRFTSARHKTVLKRRTNDDQWMCPACLRGLTNATRMCAIR